MMSRRIMFVVLSIVTFLLVGCGDNSTPEPVEMSEAQEKQQSMDWAYEYDETIFVYDVAGAVGYAICEGSTYIAGLDAHEYNRIKLSSQEALNLFLCKRNTETGNYGQVQDLGGVSPGDYLLWDEIRLHWTRYTPQ